MSRRKSIDAKILEASKEFDARIFAETVKLDFVHLSALRASGYLTCSRVNFMQVGYLTHLHKIHSLRGK